MVIDLYLHQIYTLDMPKQKTFLEARVPFTIRLPQSVYDKLLSARPDAAANMNEYVNRLVQNDLEVFAFEEVEEQINVLKKRVKGLLEK